jgi:hypothetical protein
MLAGCHFYDRDDENQLPPGWDWDAASYEAAPGRMVLADAGLVGGGETGGGGGVGGGAGPGPDGGGGAGGRDAAADTAAPAPDGPSPLEREAGDNTCELLAPNCGPDVNVGCYPASGGRGRCQRAEPGTPVGSPCAEPVNCAPGLTCIDLTCLPLCAQAAGTCPGGGRCVPYGAYEGVGYCLP